MSHIGNESAYMRATEAAIKRNRATGGLRRWIEREGEEAVDMVKDWLFCEHIYGTKHPLAFYSRGKFMDAMRAAIDNWGGLSEKQHAAVIDAYHRAEKLNAEHEQARAAALKEDRERGWIGEVGGRQEFRLTVEKELQFEGRFGTTFIFILRDAEQNVIVYKGSVFLAERGQVVDIKATIKEHGQRDGVKQTLITRPKLTAGYL